MQAITGDGRIHLAAPTYAHHATGMTAALAADVGAAYDLLVTNPSQLAGLDGNVRASGAKVLRYTKMNQEHSGSHPSAWYSHKTDGTIRKDPNWNVFCMEPSNVDWRAYHLAELQKICQDTNVDGIFSDSAGGYSFTQGGNHAGMPPGWTKPYASSVWLDLMSANLDYWAGNIPKPMILNGLAGNTVDRYTPTVGLLEAAFGSKKGTLPSLTHWQQEAQFVLDAQKAGWTPWIWIKLFGSGYAAQADKWRNLMGCTALLLDQGSLLYDLSPSEGGDPAWITKEYSHPIYNPVIGNGIESTYNLNDYQITTHPGVYTRGFESGEVYVNLTTSPFTVQLADRSFICPPQSGIIIRESTVVDYSQVV